MTREPTPETVAGLRADGVQFDASDARLVRTVAREGSVSGAASSLGRSRARALDRLETLASAFGSLVERRRGGPDGGGSRVTRRGRNLLARFARLQAAVSGTATADESVLSGEVVAVEGATVAVETGTGRVSAVFAPTAVSVDSDSGAGDDTDATSRDDSVVGTRVDVTVRADTVTVQEPAASPDPAATSARNRFTGTVAELDRRDGLVVVRVAVDGETIEAVVTADSADRLALAVDQPVVVSFKTTATRAVPRPEE